MTNTKIPQQAVMFDKGPKPEDKRPANLPGLQAGERARKKTNGYEPPNLGKAIRLTVPDFSDPGRPPVCLEVDFPIVQVNVISAIEGSSDGERGHGMRMQNFQPVSEKMQTLAAEFAPTGCRTALPDEKELATEIERSQALLQQRKRIALTSPEAVRKKKSVETKRNSGGRKGANRPIQAVSADQPAVQGTEQVGITRPMMVREDSPPYGEKRPSRGREM